MLSGVMNDAYPSGNLMDESGFGGCQRYLSDTIVSPSVKFGGGGYGVGLFFRSWAWPSSSNARNY